MLGLKAPQRVHAWSRNAALMPHTSIWTSRTCITCRAAERAPGSSCGTSSSLSRLLRRAAAAQLHQLGAAPLHRWSSSFRRMAASSSSSSSNMSTVLTLPTLLTLGRVAAIPALIAAWHSAALWAPAACAALFVGASLTDFLDGYLARKLNATSAFGAFLDPVADKLMVATVLVLLCTAPPPPGIGAGLPWALPVLTCLVIGREITMSALREWAAALGPEAHSAVAVSWLGKWKTATQMAALTLLLLGRCAAAAAAGGGGWAPPAPLAAAAAVAGLPLLAAAALLTVWSLGEYFSGLSRFMFPPA